MARLGQSVWGIVLWLSNHDGTVVLVENKRSARASPCYRPVALLVVTRCPLGALLEGCWSS